VADDGWVRIPPPTYRQRLVIGGFWTLAVAYVGSNLFVALGRRLEEALGGGALTVIATVAVGLAIAQSLVILLVTRASPALDIHAARGLLRLRGTERPFTDLVGALVEQPPIPAESRYDKPRRRPARDPLAGGGRFRVVLAIGPTTTVTPERAAALVAAVRGSRIRPPTASYDPEGRFTHLNFPGSLDIPDAIRLIEDPQRARARLR
jgi:hypothetical protein